MGSVIDHNVLKLTIENGIARFVVSRPENLNALNVDVLQSLIIEFDKLSREKELKVAIISGEGPKAFVAGADIALLQQLGKRAATDYIELGQRAMRVIEAAKFPVIAAVNGFALGGGLELALACDIIYSAPKAKFGAPEVNLGIIPGFGGTQRLVQRCGIGATRRLVLTGDLITAEEALRIGLADCVSASDDSLPQEVQAMAQNIATKGPLAVAAAKRVISRSQELALLAGLQLEVETFMEVFESVDREEGMLAFMHKRAPKFLGK